MLEGMRPAADATLDLAEPIGGASLHMRARRAIRL
jgi:hypothetical protein